MFQTVLGLFSEAEITELYYHVQPMNCKVRFFVWSKSIDWVFFVVSVYQKSDGDYDYNEIL